MIDFYKPILVATSKEEVTWNTLDGVVATEILFWSHFEEETVFPRQGLLLFESIGSKLKGFKVFKQVTSIILRREKYLPEN